MATLATYAANINLNWQTGQAAPPAIANRYIAAFRTTAGTNAASPRSTAVTVGQVTVPATPNGHAYKCTGAGTTGSGEPTWPTTSGGTVVDGGATWQEMTPDFQANNATVTGVEANFTGYARVNALTAFPAASAGAVANTSAATFPACTAGANFIFAVARYDASTVGNMLDFEILTTPVLINTTYTPLTFPIGNLTLSAA